MEPCISVIVAGKEVATFPLWYVAMKLMEGGIPFPPPGTSGKLKKLNACVRMSGSTMVVMDQIVWPEDDT